LEVKGLLNFEIFDAQILGKFDSMECSLNCHLDFFAINALDAESLMMELPMCLEDYPNISGCLIYQILKEDFILLN
jgi:hypothetical protein